MNSKTKTSNLTKSLYIILILCIISVICLSVYAFLKPKDNNNTKTLDNSENSERLNNYENENDELLRLFGTTEPKQQTPPNPTNTPTEVATEPPAIIEPTDNNEMPQAATAPPPVPEIKSVPAEDENAAEANIDLTVDTPDNDIENAVETLAVPSFFTKPLMGSISKHYNEDTLEYSVVMNDLRTHLGIDIESEIGVNVKAVADGVVTEIYDDPMMGKTIIISHAGELESIYMNLQEILPQSITVGSIIGSGDVICGVGESSLVEMSDVPHLHFAMKKDGKFINPLEYIEY